MENKPLKVGVIGLGFIGKIHAGAYAALPQMYGEDALAVSLAAVLRTHAGDERRLIASLGDPLETTQMQEFLNQDLELVDVCSPNMVHLEQIKSALGIKPHIYCEKPLGLDLAQAREIAALAEQAGVRTHTAFTYRYYPGVHQAKTILASGALGEIFNFRIHYFHNSYMDPLRPVSWRLRQADSGGGALADLGVHIIDMLRFVLGDVDWVRCNTKTMIRQRPAGAGSREMAPVDVDDWAVCMLGLKTGVPGVLEVTRLSGGVGDALRFEIFGSRGSVVYDFTSPDAVQFYDLDRKQVMVGEQDFPTPPGERPLRQILPIHKMSMGHLRDAHTASIVDFLLNIQEGKESSANFHQAVKAQEILEAAYMSAKQDGEKISLPLP